MGCALVTSWNKYVILDDYSNCIVLLLEHILYATYIVHIIGIYQHFESTIRSCVCAFGH